MTEQQITKNITNELIESLQMLKYKDDCVRVNNVYPSLIEDALGNFDDGYELNGYDCDYWASISNVVGIGSLDIFGCMRYGYAEFTKTDGEANPNDDVSSENEDVYTRHTCTLKDGTKIIDIPKSQKIDESDVAEILSDGYKPYYILFINNYSGNHQYVIIYATNEMDARKRAFSIWDRNWSDICEQEEWEAKQKFYGKNFTKKYTQKEDALVIIS